MPKIAFRLFLDVCNYQLGCSEDLLAPGSKAVPSTSYKCCLKEVKKPWQPCKHLKWWHHTFDGWSAESCCQLYISLVHYSRHFHFHLSFSFWQHIKKNHQLSLRQSVGEEMYCFNKAIPSFRAPDMLVIPETFAKVYTCFLPDNLVSDFFMQLLDDNYSFPFTFYRRRSSWCWTSTS